MKFANMDVLHDGLGDFVQGALDLGINVYSIKNCPNGNLQVRIGGPSDAIYALASEHYDCDADDKEELDSLL